MARGMSTRRMRSLLFLLTCLTLVVPLARGEDAPDLAWARQLGTSGTEFGRGVAVDATGAVYLAGTTQGSLAGTNAGDFDAFLAKYSSSGSLLWSRQFGTSGADFGESVAVDSQGNAYLCGATGGSLGGPYQGSRDAFLTKLDPAGNVLWTQQLGCSARDHAWAVAVDAVGNAFIAGESSGNLAGPNPGAPGYDAYLSKYDAAGNFLWIRPTGDSAVAQGEDLGYAATVDAQGNAYLSGWTANPLGGPYQGYGDIYLRKFDPNGNVVWTRQTGTSEHESALSLASDGLGNIYLGGECDTSLAGPNLGEHDAVLLKYDEQGNLLWSRQIGTEGNDWAYSVTADSSGNAYVVLTTAYGPREDVNNGILGGPDRVCDATFLQKYDPSGNLLWSQSFGEGLGMASHGVAVDAWGNLLVGGFTDGALGGPHQGDYDAFLVMFGEPVAPAVPEPSSFLLAVGGLLACWGIRRRILA